MKMKFLVLLLLNYTVLLESLGELGVFCCSMRIKPFLHLAELVEKDGASGKEKKNLE